MIKRVIQYFIYFVLLNQSTINAAGQQTGDPKTQYKQELKSLGKKFSQNFYPYYATLYALSSGKFIARIDSTRTQFDAVLTKYKQKLATEYVLEQQNEIKYYFDKLLVDYPMNHEIYSGRKENIPHTISRIIRENLKDFNTPSLLRNSDFIAYVRSFFAHEANQTLKQPKYKGIDNQHLIATWKLITKHISNNTCKLFWQYDYLYSHIDNNGIKNIRSLYNDFLAGCKDTTYAFKIRSLYAEDSTGREGHSIKTYKHAGNFDLDMHMFLPDMATNKKAPVILFFHGGSWSEGKPDWFFYACENYSKQGWVACAVEYRTYGRHGTLPFDAVKDARSAIRWLRQHAAEFNIDTSRIVVSGNSAGGHLALCTALADKWDEKTDDIRYSPVPNLIMVNAGVYDLTDTLNAWLRKDLPNKDIAKEISPLYLIKAGTPPILLIHGEQDKNVPYYSASNFASQMKKVGNANLVFHALKDAEHFIWFDKKYSSEVSRLRKEFLEHAGY